MDLQNSILDEAFAIYEEFGPNRRIDRKERLEHEFNQLSAPEIDFILEKMKEVSQTVWKIAERGGEAKLGKATVKQLLQAKHPFLSSKGLSHAENLVNYFAWHEGYDR